MTEFSKPSPDQEQSLPAPALIKVLGHTAAYGYGQMLTTFRKPRPLFQTVEESMIDYPQPLNPAVETVAISVEQVLKSHTLTTPRRLSFYSKLAESPRLMQFTDRIGGEEQAFFQYDHMKTLKDRFGTLAEQQQRPLSLDQQLGVALQLHEGDIMTALRALWISSRQYARWLDNVAIIGLPDMSDEEITGEIKEWRSSILACTDADKKTFQDAAGDNYYAWTHAYSATLFGYAPSRASMIGKFIFRHGTTINSRARIFRQSVPSNHRKAAEYGNRIGDVILDTLQTN